MLINQRLFSVRQVELSALEHSRRPQRSRIIIRWMKCIKMQSYNNLNDLEPFCPGRRRGRMEHSRAGQVSRWRFCWCDRWVVCDSTDLSLPGRTGSSFAGLEAKTDPETNSNFIYLFVYSSIHSFIRLSRSRWIYFLRFYLHWIHWETGPEPNWTADSFMFLVWLTQRLWCNWQLQLGEWMC